MRTLTNKPEKPALSDMKPFLTIAAGLYHLLPLVIVLALGDNALAVLSWVLLLLLPMFNVICGAIFGVRCGFSLKLPGLCTLIFAPSIIMYYNQVTTPPELVTALMSTVVNSIICFLFVTAAMAGGAFLRKYINK